MQYVQKHEILFVTQRSLETCVQGYVLCSKIWISQTSITQTTLFFQTILWDQVLTNCHKQLSEPLYDNSDDFFRFSHAIRSLL